MIVIIKWGCVVIFNKYLVSFFGNLVYNVFVYCYEFKIGEWFIYIRYFCCLCSCVNYFCICDIWKGIDNVFFNKWWVLIFMYNKNFSFFFWFGIIVILKVNYFIFFWSMNFNSMNKILVDLCFFGVF